MFDELQKRLNIQPGDPFTVARAVAKWVTETGYCKVHLHKLSDTETMYGMADIAIKPVLDLVRSRGPAMKVEPASSHTLFFAAFKKLCNMKAEKVPESEQPQVSKPEGVQRWEMWHLSPLS